MFEYAKDVQQAYAEHKAALQQEDAAKRLLRNAAGRVAKTHERLAEVISKYATKGLPGEFRAFVHDLEIT